MGLIRFRLGGKEMNQSLIFQVRCDKVGLSQSINDDYDLKVAWQRRGIDIALLMHGKALFLCPIST